MNKICAYILFKIMGFRADVTEPIPNKYIIALAPHTSNWDFIIGNLYSFAIGFKCNFLMKKEWFFWPLGYVMRALGGIPVYRDKRTRATERIAQQAIEAKTFRLCITPEGTRKPNAEWKKGFYYIALTAKIPILLYGLDFEKKLIVCKKTIIPTGDVENDMKEIKEYFKEFKGKHSNRFVY